MHPIIDRQKRVQILYFLNPQISDQLSMFNIHYTEKAYLLIKKFKTGQYNNNQAPVDV